MKKAILFIDYNGTFDDIVKGKGQVFSAGLQKFAKKFNDNVLVVVITSAKRDEIRDDLSYTLSLIPSQISGYFSYLIEDGCRNLSCIKFVNGVARFIDLNNLFYEKGSKREGVEMFLDRYDPSESVDTCLFAGDDEFVDSQMIDADIGNRKKVLFLACRRVLKCDIDAPVYKINFKEGVDKLGKELFSLVGKNQKFTVQTSPKSYGIGKALEVFSDYLGEIEEQNNN